ncbi:YqaE/Pmp3 family membrane protein [Microcoleus sp. D2_18a_D3]
MTERSNLSRIVAAIFVAPLGVFMTVGIGRDFWINLVLSCFFLFPGTIHAVWVIAKHDRA